MTSRFPDTECVLAALSGLPRVVMASKIVRKKGLLLVATCGVIQIRYMPAVGRFGGTLVLDELSCRYTFNIALGGGMHQYGLVEPHEIVSQEGSIPLFTLPGGAYFEEFYSAFSSEQAKLRLFSLYDTRFIFAMNNEQVEILIPESTSVRHLRSVIDVALDLATHDPYNAA